MAPRLDALDGKTRSQVMFPRVRKRNQRVLATVRRSIRHNIEMADVEETHGRTFCVHLLILVHPEIALLWSATQSCVVALQRNSPSKADASGIGLLHQLPDGINTDPDISSTLLFAQCRRRLVSVMVGQVHVLHIHVHAPCQPLHKGTGYFIQYLGRKRTGLRLLFVPARLAMQNQED